MSVLTADLSGWYVKNNEVPLWLEWNIFSELSHRETSAQIYGAFQPMQRDAFYDTVLHSSSCRFGRTGIVMSEGSLLIAYYLRRIADDASVGGNVLNDNSSCADHGVLPDRDAREHRRVCPDRGSLAHYCFEEIGRILLAPRPEVVREGRVGTDKNVIFERNPIP